MKKTLLLTLLLLFCLLAVQAQKLPGSLEWEKRLGGSKVDKACSVIPTVDHGFLVVGSSSSNDGDVTGHHGSTDSSDAWVVKLNSSGDVEWKQSYGGSNTDGFTHAIQAGNGDFICVGTTRSTDGDVTGLHTSNGVASDLWLMRINRYGVVQWSKVYGGSAEDHGRVIRKMADGNYIVGGDTRSNDFDITGNQGGADMWILKINEQGNLLWQKTIGNPNHQFVTSLTETRDNNFVVSGYQTYNNYPTPGPYDLLVYSLYEEASAKIDLQGNVIWMQIPIFTRGVAGPSQFVSRMFELANGNFMQVGHYLNASSVTPYWTFYQQNGSDGSRIYGLPYGINYSLSTFTYYNINDTGPDAVQMLSDSSILSCISDRYYNLTRVRNTNFDKLYQSPYSVYGYGLLNGVIALADDEYIAAGTYTNNDFWIIKVKGLNQIKGTVFIDNNANGVKDNGEPVYKNGIVESKKGGSVTASSLGTDGSFINFTDTGTYFTSVKGNGKFYYTATPASRQSVFTSYKNTDSFSVALVPQAGIKDLQVSLKVTSAMRPGFDATYRIDYLNAGTTTIPNVVVRFVKPSPSSFVSATLTPATVVADTITWNIGSLSPSDAASLNLVLRLNPPPAVNLNDRLKFYATIDPIAGDYVPYDNTDTLIRWVTGAYDPNDKQENHGDTLYLEQLQAGQPLTYTVRFQNMGTDTAFNIVVRDTLSDQLDASTLEISGASHPYQFNMKDNKYCTWTFTNILLPDHNTNDPASSGYLSYRIKPKSSLQSGDKVYNSASIYFDFNQPVQTNNKQTVITPTPVPAPPVPVLSGLQPNYCTSVRQQKVNVLNLPAATSGITVTAKVDATVLTIAADSTVTLAIATLTAGTHNLTVTYSNVTDTKTTTASFTIMVAANPDVNVTANITTVTNLANPVIVTAVNASGGGKSPLYTFAWNNSFTNILQTESSNSGVTITPAGLALGDNKVYVRMKTSESCFTAQTNTDSITIRRDQATGIVDIDNPGQVINVYPNPVNGPITVNGLSSGKSYTLTIVNLQGQVVFTKRVINQSSTTISDLKVLAGTYLLTIFDEKKNRTLGTVQLIKK